MLKAVGLLLFWVLAANVFAVKASIAEAKKGERGWFGMWFGKGWLNPTTPSGIRYRRLALRTMIIGLLSTLAILQATGY